MADVFPRNKLNFTGADFTLAKEAKKRNRLVLGQDIKLFEKSFAQYIGTRYAIGVSSARSGLMLILKALGLKPLDEIIVPAYTFHVMPAIIKSMGFRPVFVDIRKGSYNMDVSIIKEKISSRTKVILATHILGQPCDIEEIFGLSKRSGLKVIEDCAHACGAEHNGKKVGSFGDAGLFSFGMGKTMNCFGGGAITCEDPVLRNSLADLLNKHSVFSSGEINRMLWEYGLFYTLTRKRVFPFTVYFAMRLADFFHSRAFDSLPYEPAELYEELPSSFYKKFSNLQAIVGLRQLESLDERIDRIIRNAGIYNRELAGLAGVIIPCVEPKDRRVYLYYRIRVKKPRALKRRLLDYGVDAKLDDIAVCPDLGIFAGSEGDFPAAREVSETSLDLPCYGSLCEKDIYKIAGRLKKAMSAL